MYIVLKYFTISYSYIIFHSDKFYTRIITRDLSGKYSWDVSYLYASLVDMKEKQETQQLNELTNTNLRLVDSDHSNSHLITRDPPPCPPPRVNPPPLTTNRLTPNTIDQLDQLSDVSLLYLSKLFLVSMRLWRLLDLIEFGCVALPTTDNRRWSRDNMH